LWYFSLLPNYFKQNIIDLFSFVFFGLCNVITHGHFN